MTIYTFSIKMSLKHCLTVLTVFCIIVMLAYYSSPWDMNNESTGSNLQTFDNWLKSNSEHFNELTRKLSENHIGIEGHIFTEKDGAFDRRPQLEAYYKYVTNNKNRITRVCEIGFNGGHSALMWALLLGGDIEIISFDLCPSKSCDLGLEVIKEIVPHANIKLIRGDSTETVRKFHEQNTEIKCDLLSIDGGHVDDVPGKDLLNMKLLAAKDHMVVMDDVNSASEIVWMKIPGIAWENAVKNNLICPIDTCKYAVLQPEANFPIRFCFGRYC